MNVNTSEKNINNLINNNNITIPKLNTNIENNDYFKDKGIIDETTIFYDFLSINVNKNRRSRPVFILEIPRAPFRPIA